MKNITIYNTLDISQLKSTDVWPKFRKKKIIIEETIDSFRLFITYFQVILNKRNYDSHQFSQEVLKPR